jgi:uncharacterized protein
MKDLSPAIPVLVADNLERIREICQGRHVCMLSLIGSFAKGNAREKSDIDFLVTFEIMPPVQYADRYFGLLEDLTSLFGKQVDLIEEPALKNPYFIESVMNTRAVIYASA